MIVFVDVFHVLSLSVVWQKNPRALYTIRKPIRNRSRLGSVVKEGADIPIAP